MDSLTGQLVGVGLSLVALPSELTCTKSCTLQRPRDRCSERVSSIEAGGSVADCHMPPKSQDATPENGGFWRHGCADAGISSQRVLRPWRQSFLSRSELRLMIKGDADIAV